MAQFKPEVRIYANFQNQYMFGEDNKGHKIWQKSFSYKTYRKLKTDLKRLMQEYSVTEATISRSRRGEWGEWFENWRLANNKLFKIKEGWM